MAQERMIWRSSGAQQRWPLRSELCAWHFSQLPPVSASVWNAHDSWAKAALHYILLCEMEKAIWKTSAVWFAIQHTPTRSVSSLWALADSDACLLFRISITPGVFLCCKWGKFCFNLMTSIWETRGFYGISFHFVTLKKKKTGWIPEGEAAMQWRSQPDKPSFVPPVWALCRACMSHSV